MSDEGLTMSKKTSLIAVRFTTEDKGRISSLAETLGISVSEFCRRKILVEKEGADPAGGTRTRNPEVGTKSRKK